MGPRWGHQKIRAAKNGARLLNPDHKIQKVFFPSSMTDLRQLLREADAILQAREDALFQAHEDLPLDATEDDIAIQIRNRTDQILQDFPLTPAQQQAIQQRAMGILQQ